MSRSSLAMVATSSPDLLNCPPLPTFNFALPYDLKGKTYTAREGYVLLQNSWDPAGIVEETYAEICAKLLNNPERVFPHGNGTLHTPFHGRETLSKHNRTSPVRTLLIHK